MMEVQSPFPLPVLPPHSCTESGTHSIAGSTGVRSQRYTGIEPGAPSGSDLSTIIARLAASLN